MFWVSRKKFEAQIREQVAQEIGQIIDEFKTLSGDHPRTTILRRAQRVAREGYHYPGRKR